MVHGLQTENLLDRAGHVDLRVEGAVFGDPSAGAIGVHLLFDVGADDIARAAVTVDVVDAGLRIVFLDEDRRGGPDGAVADGVDKAANGQVVVGLHDLSRRRAASVVGTDPHELQLGHPIVLDVVLEVLIPDIEAELVGDAQVELRIVLHRVVDQVRERRVRGDRVVVVELAFSATLVRRYVIEEVDPLWLGGRPGGRQERVVLDVLAVVLERTPALTAESHRWPAFW